MFTISKRRSLSLRQGNAMTHSITTEAPVPAAVPLGEGFRDLVSQFGEFLLALWRSECRRTLTLLTIAIVAVICATVVTQVWLNAWNRPFYDAVAARNLSAFLYQ